MFNALECNGICHLVARLVLGPVLTTNRFSHNTMLLDFDMSAERFHVKCMTADMMTECTCGKPRFVQYVLKMLLVVGSLVCDRNSCRSCIVGPIMSVFALS